MPTSIQYSIDKADHIRFINEGWLQFACQNAGGHLNRAYVIGKSIWDFIEGEDLRQIYRHIFKAVRMKQQAAVFKFRCDSPVCRRYFQLTGVSSSGGGTDVLDSSHSCGSTRPCFVP